MKKIIVILSGMFLGSLILGTDITMDKYYDNMDESCPILSAHQKTKKYGNDLMRKRAYRRKRMRRLPNNGK
jgi:hypothetical protein